MYSTTTRKQVKVRVRPAPVRSTVILFDGGRRMRPARPFGAGILKACPTHRLPCTLADLDAVAGLFAGTDRERAEARLAVQEEYDARVDQAAFEDACLQRYTRGYCL
jgi:hypothetical protein